MATDYRCPGCDLRFSTRRYHYHRIETGYGGRALLACSARGTQHAIELALPNRGSEFYTDQRLIVETVPAVALSRVAQWLRRDQKQPMGLESALEIARNPPFALFESTWEERAAKAKGELQSLGVRLRRKNGRAPQKSQLWSLATRPRSVSERPRRVESTGGRVCQRSLTLLKMAMCWEFLLHLEADFRGPATADPQCGRDR